MTDEFFAGFDNEMSKSATSQSERQQVLTQAEAFAERAIPLAVTQAEEVAAGLAQRGVTATVIPGGRSVTFAMKYKNGDKHDMTLALEADRPGLSVTSYHVDENRRSYSATSGVLYREDNWTETTYRDLLKKHVTDYASYASRHGGIA